MPSLTLEAGKLYIFAAWSLTEDRGTVDITGVGKVNSARGPGAMQSSVSTPGIHSFLHVPTTTVNNVIIRATAQEILQQANMAGNVGGANLDSGNKTEAACWADRGDVKVPGPFIGRTWNFSREDASESDKPVIFFMVVELDYIPGTHTAAIDGFSDSIFGKHARFEFATFQGPDPATITELISDDRLQIKLDYEKKGIPNGQPHIIVLATQALPTHDTSSGEVYVASFLPFKSKARQVTTGNTYEPNRHEGYTVVPVDRDGVTYQHAATYRKYERAWHNHEAASALFRNPHNGEGLFVVAVTFSNGAHSFKDSTDPADYPLARARISLVTARMVGSDGKASKGSRGLLWFVYTTPMQSVAFSTRTDDLSRDARLGNTNPEITSVEPWYDE